MFLSVLKLQSEILHYASDIYLVHGYSGLFFLFYDKGCCSFLIVHYNSKKNTISCYRCKAATDVKLNLTFNLGIIVTRQYIVFPVTVKIYSKPF